MKVALLFSGHMRSFETTYTYFKENLYDKYQVDTFITTWETSGWWTGDESGALINSEKNYINFEKVRKSYNPVVLDVQNYFDYYENYFKVESQKYKNLLKDKRVRLLNPFSQFYKLQRIVNIFEEYVLMTNKKYDVVIRTRPDVVLTNFNVKIPEDSLIIDGSKGIDLRGIGDMLQMGKQELILKLNRVFFDYDSVINSCSLYCPHLYMEKYFQKYDIKYEPIQRFSLHNAKNGEYRE